MLESSFPSFPPQGREYNGLIRFLIKKKKKYFLHEEEEKEVSFSLMFLSRKESCRWLEVERVGGIYFILLHDQNQLASPRHTSAK